MARSPFEGATGIKYLVHVQSTFERFSVGASTEDKHMNQDQFQRFCEEMGLVNQEMSRRLFLAMDDDNTGAMEAYEFLAGIRKMCDESGGASWLKERIKFAFMLFGALAVAPAFPPPPPPPPPTPRAWLRFVCSRARALVADLDREETVDQSEIKGFLKTFYTVGKGEPPSAFGASAGVLGAVFRRRRHSPQFPVCVGRASRFSAVLTGCRRIAGLIEGWVEQFERMFGAEVAVLPSQ